MSINSTAYYRERAATERELALKAERADVAAIHEELARQYQALVDNEVLRPSLRLTEDREKGSS